MERFDDFLITLSQLWIGCVGTKSGCSPGLVFSCSPRSVFYSPARDQATSRPLGYYTQQRPGNHQGHRGPEPRAGRDKKQALTDTRQSLADAWQREQSPQAALAEAVSAIPEQTEIPNAQARIQEAQAQATQGNTGLAEAILSKVETRKIAEGEAAKKAAS